jgi:predicted small lipoprotein YifL
MPLNRLAIVALCLALAGCGSFGAISFPSFKKTAQQPEPINPAAVPPVETSALPPPPTTTTTAQATPPAAEALPNGVDAQAPAPAAGSQPMPPPPAGALGRTDLLGGWTIASGGDSCQLFMTLTSWTGGYRASTRGCTSDTLKSISAWNLDGKQVVLAGTGGTPIARLYASGGNRFDGQTEGQASPVSFYR